jgi:hypothetical protein
MRKTIVAPIAFLIVLGVGAAAAVANSNPSEAEPADTASAEAKSQPLNLKPAEHPAVDKTATLGEIDLAEFQNKLLPDSISDDRGLLLGSIGSGMFSAGHREYWTITDRGPNGEPGDYVRSFPLPAFDPTLVKVKVRGEKIEVLKSIPLVTESGDAVTGLPPFVRTGDPSPALTDGTSSDDLLNPNGVDSEGVVATSKGFWIVDEYGPSILSVSPEGEVLTRYVPEGTKGQYQGSDARIVDNLPAELATRTANRGFEDIALLPDGKTLVVGLQSPLDGQTDSLTTRLVVFDTDATKVVDTYKYVFDGPWTFYKEPGELAKAKHLKLSALVPLSQDRVLVQERTDIESRFYEVRLGNDPILSGSDKRLIVNLAGVRGVPDKIEGAVLKNPDTLALISDNDFGFDTEGYVPPSGDIPLNGVKTTYVEVKLQ